MLMPQELKKHEFSRSFRGYTVSEVEEYVDFVSGKYEEIYRENDELTRKLGAALKALDEVKSREAKIVTLETEVKRAAAKILADAEQKRNHILADAQSSAEKITENARETAEKIRQDSAEHIEAQRETFASMKRTVLAFRDEIYARYNEHIDRLEQIAAFAEAASFDEPLPDSPASVIPNGEEPGHIPQDGTAQSAESEPTEPCDSGETMEYKGTAADTITDLDIASFGNFDELPEIPDLPAFHAETVEQPAATPLVDIIRDGDDFSFRAMDNVESAFAAHNAVSEEKTESKDIRNPKSENTEDTDDALLTNLRRAFRVEYETIPTKNSRADDSGKNRDAGN